MNLLQIHRLDNVAVALAPLEAGAALGGGLTARETVAAGHKVALRPIASGQNVVKYGCPIGRASRDIAAGEWVHVHNLKTGLTGPGRAVYRPVSCELAPVPAREFRGFLRPDGRAGVRNELWILPLVGCVNGVAQSLARENAGLAAGTVDGVYAFPHPYGCSQMDEDHARTRTILAALAGHPNAGGVLVLGLGCENLTREQFERELGDYDRDRVRILICQDADDELAEGARLLRELAAYAGRFARQPISVSKLVVGLKCGGSDGLSGVTANPAVGAFSDSLVAQGGTAILTEVPEMFGAEELLLGRCADEGLFRQAAAMVEACKDDYTAHGQPVYENPSPGNKAGGITTLEEKSCGCVQKGGSAPVRGVLGYGETVRTPGLNLLSGPGNDLISATALTAAGAQLVLFTTGRGTPFGAPAPTVKIATNTPLYERKRRWMDFDAGPVARGETAEMCGARLMETALVVCSGERTRSERAGYREIAILRGGVTL